MSRRHVTCLFAAVICIVTAAFAQAATPRHPDELDLGPVDLALPAPVDTVLSSGIRLLVFENHDLPLVSVTANVTMGERYLPLSERTAYGLLSRLWDEGGAGDLPPAELEAQVAALGMTLSAQARYDEGLVRAHMTREDLDRGLPLWRDLLIKPRLADERLERARAQKLKDLLAINDDPARLAGAWIDRLLYGPQTPGGHIATRAEVEAVSRDDLLQLHDRFVVPSRTVIGVAGDITVAEAMARLEALFAGWRDPKGLEPLVRWPWMAQPQPGVYVLPGDFEQCHVRLGRIIPDLTDLSPDYALSRVASFGVGYLRVYYAIRQAGLSYGTATMLEVDVDSAVLRGFGSTSNDQVVELLSMVRDQIANLAEAPLDADEVKTSRAFFLSSVLKRFETANDVVSNYVSDMARGRPQGYQQDLMMRTQGATAEALDPLLPQWMNFGDQAVVLVVGTPEGGVESLEELGWGEVTVLEAIRFGE